MDKSNKKGPHHADEALGIIVFVLHDTESWRRKTSAGELSLEHDEESFLALTTEFELCRFDARETLLTFEGVTFDAAPDLAAVPANGH